MTILLRLGNGKGRASPPALINFGLPRRRNPAFIRRAQAKDIHKILAAGGAVDVFDFFRLRGRPVLPALVQNNCSPAPLAISLDVAGID